MLRNATTGKTIMQKHRVAGSVFRRFKGLMLEKRENFDYALVFELGSESGIGASVHMMFMRFPIDIIFLDAAKKVVDKATLMPWALNYTPKKAAKYFAEMPEGKGKQISIGDKLEWKT